MGGLVRVNCRRVSAESFSPTIMAVAQFRTAEDSGLGGGTGRGQAMRLGIILQQLLTKRKKLGFAERSHEVERAIKSVA